MTYCSVVTVLALVDFTKKRFGHYAILKILSLRSPRNTFFWRSVALPCEKVIFAFERSYITSTIRKSMLNVPVPGIFLNIGHQI